MKNQCPRCLNYFSTSQRLQSHLRRKIRCEITDGSVCNYKNEEISNANYAIENKKFICEFCQSKFTRKDNMIAHQKKSCKPLIQHNGSNTKLEQKVDKLEKQLAELSKKPSNIINNQNILQVVCIGSNDNYLDMLTEQIGFDKALGFIKDCALSQLAGDCKLVEKIYMNQSNNQLPFRFADKSRTKIEYFNENKEKIIDKRGIQLGKRLANNLQNSYLKGVNYLILKNLDNHSCPNIFLEQYDVMTWNHHIYELSDVKYQRKIIDHLNIGDAIIASS